MSRNRGSECCEYREERRRLARQKLRTTMKVSKNAKKKLLNDCDDDDDDDNEEAEIKQERKCEEKRAQRIEALTKILSLGDEMIRRIKPSIEERDKYSMSYRHIRCFLEPAEIEEMELEQRMRRFFKCMPCETSKFDEAKAVVDEGENESENKTDSATADEEEEPEPKDEKEEPKKEQEKPKNKEDKPSNKSEFWCREVKKKPKLKRDERQFELDCKDSICSFDSEFDLTGKILFNDEN
ncbi:nucleolin-like [Venturia canescens]|uniref:nucleolin-like n=1 Tax=Venturia canescens TaxID=32260 RepID=UPI001C9C3319|nr:nucleolin-like [Venturia canescens]